MDTSRPVFDEFIEAVCRAARRRNAKSICTAVTKATKAFNKIADKHPGFIETLEREEIIDFFNKAVLLTGLEFDPSIDLTEEHRAW